MLLAKALVALGAWLFVVTLLGLAGWQHAAMWLTKPSHVELAGNMSAFECIEIKCCEIILSAQFFRYLYNYMPFVLYHNKHLSNYC